MPQSSVSTPNVKPGLTIDPSARIEGDLEYSQAKDLTFPAGVVIGKVTRTAPVTDGRSAAREQTSAQKAAKWTLDFVRNSVTMLLIGLLLLWLFPNFVRGLSDHLQARPLPSLGWGVVAWAGFFFALILVICVMVIGGILFGVLTLGQLTGTVIGLGLLTLFALIVGFVLVTSFVAKVVFGAAFGRWMLVRLHSPLAEHRYWPMALGVLVTVAVIPLFSSPFTPHLLGGLLNFAVALFGLGALWLWGRERMMKKTVSVTGV
jgi:hypothetical protein